jgi:plastocyanin
MIAQPTFRPVPRHRLPRRLAGLCAVLFLAHCGGSPSAPSADVTITISSSGLSPADVRIPVGGRVAFVNSDARPHAMSSDPVQIHTDCPAINDVGFLNPGQSRNTGALTVARVCGFHDHTNENDPTWKGRIVVQ